VRAHIVSEHLTESGQFCAKCKLSFNFPAQVHWKCEPAVLGENLLNMTSVTETRVGIFILGLKKSSRLWLAFLQRKFTCGYMIKYISSITLACDIIYFLYPCPPFPAGGHRSTRRKLTTFGRALTIFLQESVARIEFAKLRCERRLQFFSSFLDTNSLQNTVHYDYRLQHLW
jgi:hypothetical protein